MFKNGEMIYSNKRLTDLELKILKILRESSHRVSLGDIIETSVGQKPKVFGNLNSLSRNIRYDASIVRIDIRSLLNKGYIKQDDRDTVDWDDLEATFYTKAEIDEKLRKV